MLAVVVYLGIVSLLSGAFFVAMNRAMDRVSVQEAREAGRCLAEAGVEKALAELQSDASYRGEAGTPLGEGTFDVSVEPQPSGVYRIRSMGLRGYGEAVPVRIEAEATVSAGVVSGLRWIEETGR